MKMSHGEQAYQTLNEEITDIDGVTVNSSSITENGHIPPLGGTDDMTRCGIGNCRWNFLEMCNNAKVFCACLCWFGFIQGFMVNGVNNVNTATLERRYDLTSTKAGMISSSYDISAAVFAIPITYYGAHAHQPRMLTWAAVIMMFGAFVMIIPHLGTGLYSLKDSQADVCLFTNVSALDCDVTDSRRPMWLGVFVIGMFLIGVGGATLYSVGIVFLDTCVHSRASPVYQGIFSCSATLGPAVGYLLGGYFLHHFYVDFDRVNIDSAIISADDPRFVGAWWIGFLIGCVLLSTVILSLACYPRELPGSREARQESHSEVHVTDVNAVVTREGFGTVWRDMPTAILVLLRNPAYVCTVLAAVCDGQLIAAMATFITKFIQNQFALTAGNAATLAGLASVPGAAGGQLIGALICKFASLNVRGMLKLNICLAVASILSFGTFFLRCSTPSIAGVNVDYKNYSVALSAVDMTAACNDHCGCTTLSYEPICGINNVQYFSACHAGCLMDLHNDSSKIYTDCSCIGNTTSEDAVSMASSGTCDADCKYVNAFLVLICISMLLVFMNAIPTLTVILRVVPESQRSFSLGIKAVFVRFLGTIPGPIIMGSVFDSTCKVWQERACGSGSCWIYDSYELSCRVFTFTVIVKLFSLVFFSLAHALYKAPREDEHEMVVIEEIKEAISETVNTSGSDANANIR